MSEQINIFTLSNAIGEQVEISNYGARIVKWLTRVNGQSRNIVVGYDNPQDYLNDSFYLGAIVGPYANRINNARVDHFYDQDKPLQLNSNEGQHQLHGGHLAFANQFWRVVDYTAEQITLSCELADGYNGYPGPIYCQVCYRLSSDASEQTDLNIDIEVSSEKVTIAGPTVHPYFNLSGSKNLLQHHQLSLNTNALAAMNDNNIPTGEIITLAPPARLNFQQGKPLSEQQKTMIIDDNFFVKDGFSGDVVEHARLMSPDHQLSLCLQSNYPCLQVYTGTHLSTPFQSHQGICLEPQFAPNSPNQDAFTLQLTTPQQPLIVSIKYRLVKH